MPILTAPLRLQTLTPWAKLAYSKPYLNASQSRTDHRTCLHNSSRPCCKSEHAQGKNTGIPSNYSWKPGLYARRYWRSRANRNALICFLHQWPCHVQDDFSYYYYGCLLRDSQVVSTKPLKFQNPEPPPSISIGSDASAVKYLCSECADGPGRGINTKGASFGVGEFGPQPFYNRALSGKCVTGVNDRRLFCGLIIFVPRILERHNCLVGRRSQGANHQL